MGDSAMSGRPAGEAERAVGPVKGRGSHPGRPGRPIRSYVSVNRFKLARNTKMRRLAALRRGDMTPDEPPIRVQRGKSGEKWYAFEVAIDGPSWMMYDPEKALLPCGARLVLVTDSRVRKIK